MVVEPYANIPYRRGESKSKLGVQYPKNMVPIKPLREMQMEENPNLGILNQNSSPVKREMNNI